MKKTKMLKKNYEFKTVFNKGKASGGRYLVAFIKNNNKPVNFLGIAVGVKIAKATKRNYLKRLIRESYQMLEMQVKDGYTIVFTCKKNIDIKNIKYAEIQKDMTKILKRANVLNSNFNKNEE